MLFTYELQDTKGSRQAEGAVFDNGRAITIWPDPTTSVQIFNSFTDARRVHVQLGRRTIVTSDGHVYSPDAE